MEDDVIISGHSRRLRDLLRAARERLNLDQAEVGRRVAERMERDKPYLKQSVSAWEKFEQHPGIDVFAAWARVLGLRLIVDLDDAKGERIPVMLQKRSAEIARGVDMLDGDLLEGVRDSVSKALELSRLRKNQH